MPSPAHGRRMTKPTTDARREEERRRFADDLKTVGDNLPEKIVGTEGADVGSVVRDGKEGSLNPLARDPKVRARENEIEQEPVDLDGAGR